MNALFSRLLKSMFFKKEVLIIHLCEAVRVSEQA